MVHLAPTFQNLIAKAKNEYHVDDTSLLVITNTERRVRFIAKTQDNQLLFVSAIFSDIQDTVSFDIFDDNEEQKLRDWILGQ